MIVNLIGVDPTEVSEETIATNGAYAQFSYLASDFASRLIYIKHNLVSRKVMWWRLSWINNKFFGCTYCTWWASPFSPTRVSPKLIWVIWGTFVTSIWFTNLSRAVAFTHMYTELSVVFIPKTRQLVGYLTPLQV